MPDRRHRQEPFIKERRRGGDRRAEARTETGVPLELTAGGQVYFHLTADLSPGGARLDRVLPLPVGTRVSMTLELPGDPPPLKCTGEVVREEADRGLGTGVRLVDASEADRTRIARFLDRAG